MQPSLDCFHTPDCCLEREKPAFETKHSTKILGCFIPANSIEKELEKVELEGLGKPLTTNSSICHSHKVRTGVNSYI